MLFYPGDKWLMFLGKQGEVISSVKKSK
jgi:hypothetical protein